MNKIITKIAGTTFFALVLVLGIRLSTQQVNILSETASVTVLSLGFEAQAYCNDTPIGTEIKNGVCSGTANQPDSRCLGGAIGTTKFDCVR